ncbi:hypothetical protein [Algibacter aquimarinus]|uniref:Uncharacterized protein n=1 Tax=Algibacter aquimarinus TaxID=1136748 RepID=A0ABP9H7E4_9FLAO
MKSLKITLILALLLTMFSSCTKQDLNENDVLTDNEAQEYFTGGQVKD